MPRFFVDSKQINDNQIVIIGEDAKHINVLRYKPDDNIILSDGLGYDYSCKIVSIKKDEVVTEIQEKTKCLNESDFKITLFQGLPKADKMEMIIQKSVELGVYNIVPVETERTVVSLGEKSSKKTARWQKISESAAKQCERGMIPIVFEPVSFKTALELFSELDEVYVAYEKECVSAKKIFADSKGANIGIFIGPEGGFTAEEIKQCEALGATSFSLGKRILRTETAGFAAIISLILLREEL